MFVEDFEACTYPSAYGTFNLRLICVSLCRYPLIALLGPAMFAFPPGVIWGSAGVDGRLMALPGSLRAVDLWLGLVPLLSAPFVGGLWAGYL